MDSWSEEDDKELETAARDVAAGSRGRWAAVAERITGQRDGQQCKARYELLNPKDKARGKRKGRGSEGATGAAGECCFVGLDAPLLKCSGCKRNNPK